MNIYYMKELTRLASDNGHLAVESLSTQQLPGLLSLTPQQLQSGSKGLEGPWGAAGLQSTLEAEEADSSKDGDHGRGGH